MPTSVIYNNTFDSDGADSSVHGTACAEIVYDIAPQAQLYMVEFGTDVELGNAVDWLITQNVDVISFSMGYPGYGPGDGTGLINDIVTRAKNAGILWVSAAGNHAQKHWSGSFSDTDGDRLHNFGETDGENNIAQVGAGQVITGVLSWDDTWGASSNDYDLLLFNSSGIVAWSADVQNGNDDPYESLSYQAPSAGTYGFAIGTLVSPAARTFHLFSSHTLQYQTAAGSLLVPADSPNALTVGAVAYNSSPMELEIFSSHGPTKDNRTKPDLVGYDRVSTVSYGSNAFAGTSAATPHAAGAAVLVKQAFPAYTPAQIQSYLEGKAVDLGSSGKDNLYGSGRLNLPTYNLTTAVNGSGSVTPSAGAHTYPAGMVVAIAATPAAGWQFVNWTGSVADANAASTTATVDDNKTVTANFSLISYNLTMAKSGNGNITPEVGAHAYPPGTSVNITAAAATNWAFINWTGNVSTVADASSANSTIIMNNDYTISQL